jgi:hypothetical protein
MPECRSAPQERTVPLQADIQVVDECLDGAEIENAKPRPILGEHARNDRKKHGFRLSTSGGGKHDQMVARQDRRNYRILEWSQLAPSEAVDDMVL